MSWWLLVLLEWLLLLPCWALWLRHKRWQLTERNQHELAMEEAKLASRHTDLDAQRLGLDELAAKAELARIEAAGSMLPSYNIDKLPEAQRDRALAILEA